MRRILFGEVYSLQLQLAGSGTRTAGVTHGGAALVRPLRPERPHLRCARHGQRERPGFRALSGFFPRPGLSHANLDPRVTLYGRSGGLIESVTGDVNLDGLYRYDRFVTGAGMQEEKVHFNGNVRLRGGWTAGASVLIEAFGYPSEVYARTTGSSIGGRHGAVRRRAQDPEQGLRAAGRRRRSSRSSPGTLFLLWGHDENFFEWASADITLFNAGLDWRPTDKLRLSGTYQLQRVGRRTDGSTVNIQHIPRLKLEYQVSRPGIPPPGR